jgi:RNA polymerase sigma-70 factor (ECF subfamily)
VDTLTDEALIQAIARGDEWALQELYTRHGPAILAYLIGRLNDRAQAEEVLQDVLLAVWRGAVAFRGESKVRTWLLSIAHHKVCQVYSKHQIIPIELRDDIPVPDPNSDYSDVAAALHHLPAPQRETLELVFYHRLTGPEAAAVLGVSVGTIKSRMHRALLTLRQVLIKEIIENG